MNLRNTFRAVAMVVAVYFLLCSSPVAAAMLSPGDIVVASLGELQDEGDGALIKVNPVTGDRTIISGPGVGIGPGFDPRGVAVTTMNDIFIAEHSSASTSVLRVDVATGNRQVIASSNVGTGPVLQSAFDVIARSDGKLVVVDTWGATLMLVDPVTLERSILSGPGVGAGPDLVTPVGMTLDANGDILITMQAPFDQPSTLVKVDVLTGDREIVSASDVGSGPVPGTWFDVAVDGDGRAFVTSAGDFFTITPAVHAIDLVTGDRTIVSATGMGVGPGPLQPWGIGIETDGQILVTDLAFPNNGALIRIDPTTGDRTVLSTFGVGNGPSLQSPRFFDIVPVPEPSTAFLFITGLLFVVLARCSRRSSRPGGLLLR